MIVYKKVRRLKDGNCYPLFIDKTNPFRFGEWMQCEFHPTKGFAERSLDNGSGSSIGGWHCCFEPNAPHLSDKLSSGEQRVWIECDADGIMQTYKRPESQGGAWILVEKIKPIRVIEL